MGAKSIGFVGGAAAGGTGGLSGLLNCCGYCSPLNLRFASDAMSCPEATSL